MTLSTYTDLKASIADWLHRPNLTSQIVDFIALAESEINTEMRMRLMETDATLSLVSDTSTVALPARYSEPILLELVLSGIENIPLKYLTPEQLPVQTGSGEPEYWTINGENIQFPFVADQTYSLRFRHLADFDLATTETNALLTKYPGIYLYGALLQAAPYTVNEKRIPTWQMMYDRLKAKAIKKEGRTRKLSTMQTDVPMRAYRTKILQG